MNLSVQSASDGSLRFRTPAQELVATLSPTAVTVLSNLAQVPVGVNPIVYQHAQMIMQHLPAALNELALLDLTTHADDGTVHRGEKGAPDA